MNLDDVRQRLLSHTRRGTHVSIGDDDGRLPGYDNTAVLRRRPDGSWFTAYFERGSYQDVRDFTDEDAACRDFLRLVGADAGGAV